MDNKSKHQPNPEIANLPEQVKRLLIKLTQTREDEISCDDVQTLLAAFTEMQQEGKDIADWMPQVKNHLELCHACREEYEALLLAIEAERKINSQ